MPTSWLNKHLTPEPVSHPFGTGPACLLLGQAGRSLGAFSCSRAKIPSTGMWSLLRTVAHKCPRHKPGPTPCSRRPTQAGRPRTGHWPWEPWSGGLGLASLSLCCGNPQCVPSCKAWGPTLRPRVETWNAPHTGEGLLVATSPSRGAEPSRKPSSRGGEMGSEAKP